MKKKVYKMSGKYSLIGEEAFYFSIRTSIVKKQSYFSKITTLH